MCACMHACISVTQPVAFLLPAVVSMIVYMCGLGKRERERERERGRGREEGGGGSTYDQSSVSSSDGGGL